MFWYFLLESVYRSILFTRHGVPGARTLHDEYSSWWNIYFSSEIGVGLESHVSGVVTPIAAKADARVIAAQPLSLAGATTQALDAPASIRVDVIHYA
jgi:hypothetical protein